MDTYADFYFKGPSLLKTTIKEGMLVKIEEGNKSRNGRFTVNWSKKLKYIGTFYPSKSFKKSLNEVVFVFESKKGYQLAYVHRSFYNYEDNNSFYSSYYTLSIQPEAMIIRKI